MIGEHGIKRHPIMRPEHGNRLLGICRMDNAPVRAPRCNPKLVHPRFILTHEQH